MARIGVYAVTLRFGRDVIWSGKMQVHRDNGTASVSMNQGDEVGRQSRSMGSVASQRINSGFNIEIRRNGAGRTVSVTVDYRRSFYDGRTVPIVCSDREAGMRGIRFQADADLTGGAGVTLSGDGGSMLTVIPSA